jgi:non-ribosomal peptide synthetase component F
VALRETLTHDLKKLSQRQGATLFMTLMAAFTTLLHRYSGEVEIVLGCPVANRHRPEIENLIGSFVNTLVLNINVTGSSSFIELLAGVRTSCLAAFAHQELPFEKLVEELQPERSLNHNPLFQTFFAFQQTPLPVLTLPGLSSESLEVSSNSSKFDLTLSLAE